MNNNNQQETVNKILEVYAKLFYPTLKMKVSEIKTAGDRFYLIHSECSDIISLIPPLKYDDNIGK